MSISKPTTRELHAVTRRADYARSAPEPLAQRIQTLLIHGAAYSAFTLIAAIVFGAI
jgi:hypothetical protein